MTRFEDVLRQAEGLPAPALRTASAETRVLEALREQLNRERPAPRVSRRPTPACLALLGLDSTCTVQDVKRAFRTLALRTHPDRAGGSTSAFVQARKAFDQAIAFVDQRPP